MKENTSRNNMVPVTDSKLRVQPNTRHEYIDFICFYSLYFNSTLLSERDVLLLSHFLKEFVRQVMTKYFDLNNKELNQDFKDKMCVDLQN